MYKVWKHWARAARVVEVGGIRSEASRELVAADRMGAFGLKIMKNETTEACTG